MSKVLVTAKVNPDLDGVSCTLSYADFLKQTGKISEGVIFGDPQSEVQYFIEKEKITIPTKNAEFNNDWSSFILVDASSTEGLPSVVSSDKVIEVIDHRKGEPEKKFPNAKIQNELIGAAATLVVEKFIKENLKPKPDHAKLLYGAIYHNTLNFTSSNTSDRDMKAAMFLENEFDLNKKIIQEMFEYATSKVKENVKKALEDDAKEFGEGYKIGAYQLIVWDNDILKNKQKIEEVINKLSRKYKVDWSWLNIVNVKAKKSIIYCSNKVGKEIFAKILGCEFQDNWSELEKPWLRKQIAAKINEILLVN